MSHEHPQSIPVKMSLHTSMFFLSPAGAKASCWDVGASSSTPNMLGCGYPHLAEVPNAGFHSWQ